ncbi:Regulating synaptic membrane exocytosis protein 2 [Gonapodya sp. JEL0774]|nr:Regulating synaptic membrane exocytosis protein 2 [Gonapodya sp. JEL0774]
MTTPITARELHCKIQEAKIPPSLFAHAESRAAYCSVYLDDREVFSTNVSTCDGESMLFNEEFYLEGLPPSSSQLTFTFFSSEPGPIVRRSASVVSSHSRSHSRSQSRGPTSPISPASPLLPLGQSFKRSLREKPLGAVSLPASLVMSHVIRDENWWVLTPVTEDAGRVSGEVHLKIAYQALRIGVAMQSAGWSPTSKHVDIDDQLVLAMPTADANHVFAVTLEAARDLLPRGDSEYANPYAVIHLLPDPDTASMQHTAVCRKTTDPKFRQDFIFTLKQIHPYHRLHIALWDYNSKSGFHDEFLGHVFINLQNLVDCSDFDEWYTLLPAPAISFEAILKRQLDGKSRKQGFAKARAFVKALQQQQANPSECYSSDNPISGQLLAERNYALATIIGHNVSNREEIATAILRIAEHRGKALEFVRSAVVNEIQEASV